MISSIQQFEKYWLYETKSTQKILDSLTDTSLSQKVASNDRSLGQIAWHLVTAIPKTFDKIGLQVEGVIEGTKNPNSASEIAQAYSKVAKSLLDTVKANWNDEILNTEDEMFGRKRKKGFVLKMIIDHQIHHRGQMTVLMHQAGVKVPGLYGPSREEWEQYGLEIPVE